MVPNITYSGFDQSRPAGHNRAPVRSWLKPRSAFTLRARGGTRLCPLGVIQSRTAPLRLLVSSPLAPDAPWKAYWTGINFWCFKGTKKLTSSATMSTSSSEPCSKRSSKPGTDLRSSSKTRCSRLSLKDPFVSTIACQWLKKWYSTVKFSSGTSANLPIHKSPLVRSAWKLHST